MGLVVITMFAPLLGVVTAVAAAHGATLPAGAKMTRPLLRTYKSLGRLRGVVAAPAGQLSATVAAHPF